MIEVQLSITIPGVGAETIAIKRAAAGADNPIDAATKLLVDAVGYAADWMDAGCPQVGDVSGSARDEG